MGINSMFKEIYYLNMLKKKGYSLIEIEGNDGEVRVSAMRLEGKKKIEINGNTYIINPKKRKIKGGMTLYRFKQGTAVSEDTNGKYLTTPADSKLLNEAVLSARAIGQNSGLKDKKQELIMIGIGVAIGGMLGYIVGGAF